MAHAPRQGQPQQHRSETHTGTDSKVKNQGSPTPTQSDAIVVYPGDIERGRNKACACLGDRVGAVAPASSMQISATVQISAVVYS